MTMGVARCVTKEGVGGLEGRVVVAVVVVVVIAPCGGDGVVAVMEVVVVVVLGVTLHWRSNNILLF